MRTHPVRRVLLGAALGGIIVLAGCNGEPEPPAAAAAATGAAATGSSGMPVKSGGMMDTSVSPAPPGVKTGLEGGRKN